MNSEQVPEPGIRTLSGGTWLALSPVIVRSTGFPAHLLNELRPADQPADAPAFAAEMHRAAGALAALVGRDEFREALAWQNPDVLTMADSFRAVAGEAERGAKQRKREHRLARYAARYCGKVETIGFFGPVAYGVLTGDAGHIVQRPGRALVADRRTFAEPWAVKALAACLRQDPEIAAWLPLRLRTDCSVRDGVLLRPLARPVPLSKLEHAILDACDGVRPRCEVAETVAGDLGVPPQEVQAGIAALEQRRYLVGGANLPLKPECVHVLRERLAAIGDARVARKARTLTEPFLEAVDALGRCAGDADAIRAAQFGAAAAFHDVTGRSGTRREGMMYAGRGLAYEECLRDLTLELGRDFEERLAEGLPALLTAARWLTWRTAGAYDEHFRRAWSGDPRRLDAVWSEVMAGFFGAGHKPIDDVLAEFRARWRRVIEELHGRTSGWVFDPEEFRTAIELSFAAPAPGWSGGAVHSPDLQLAAHAPDGTRTGEYSIVLGEMHLGLPTGVGPVFEWPYGGYRLSELLQSATRRGYLPAMPDDWPRNTGRTTANDAMPGDPSFAFTDVEATMPGTVGFTEVRVEVRDREVVAILPDEAVVPIREFFGFFLSLMVVDAFKSLDDGPHTPRITVGRFVVARETWRVDVAGEEFVRSAGEFESYRAVQSWRRGLGVPEQVYLKVDGEVKPIYVDFGVPVLVLSFLAALRSALRRPDASSIIAVSEALPIPGEAWVCDRDSSTYLGEVRMTVIDPVPTIDYAY